MLKPTATTIADLQTQVATLEGINLELTTAAGLHATAIEGKEAEIASAAEAHASALQISVLAAETFEGQVATLTGTVATHIATIAARDAKILELTTAATTVDAAADVKAREIAARNGAELPGKQPGAGNKTTENAEVATGTPMQKLAAVFEPRG